MQPLSELRLPSHTSSQIHASLRVSRCFFFFFFFFFKPVCGRGDLAELVFFSQHHLYSFSLSYTPESCPAKKKKSVRCSGSVRRSGDLYRTLHKGIPEGRCSPITVFRERIPPLSLNVEQDVEKIICRAFSILST